ncbi:hypothetical protein Q4517_01390 [Tenacibaculum sp. 1_MG-2023]|uniref:hypothetical protein n=1 Tax=Tenacibaculum sp. 1_MG-2023 TaxID=3062653 RepID=UPI0026E2781D|nr:hypothetical protein [Tenacibaculum sp. 1_MG-2023]MDO6674201.1 hypothetical protein [Tenacibaculum sp. 1_MG-2023]
MTKEKERTYKGIASFDSGKGNTMEITFPKVRPALKFIANLRRLDNYKGEFGFDWMRDDYQTICEDYEKLKKEYTPTKIHDKDYFVPWLSMFPQQENVKLKLEVEILEGTATDVDIIKLPKKDGIRFEPEEVKVSEANEKEISVFCDTSISNDMNIKLFDKDDNPVGEINIFRNKTIHNLKVKIVKVVRKNSSERDLRGINEALQQVDLNNYLNKNSLNQALIKTSIENNNTNVIELDTEQLTKDKKLDGAGFKDNVEQVSSMFLDEYMQKYEQESKHKGLLVFVTILRKPGTAGDGQLLIGDARNCSIFYDGRYQPTTYAHEIAHVLGCMHPFDEFNEEKINEINKRIQKYTDKIKIREDEILKDGEKIKRAEKRIIEMKKYPNNLTAIKNIKVNTNNIKVYQKNIENRELSISKIKEFINKDKKRKEQLTHIKNENEYSFPIKDSTKENFMDYTISRSARISFWSWQWRTMQNDIKRYYE